MNPKQIQRQDQWVAVLLFAGLILALAASLVWIRLETTAFFQSVKMRQACAYSPESDQMEPSAAGVDCPGADLGQGESGLRPEIRLRSVKGGKGGANGGDVYK